MKLLLATGAVAIAFALTTAAMVAQNRALGRKIETQAETIRDLKATAKADAAAHKAAQPLPDIERIIRDALVEIGPPQPRSACAADPRSIAAERAVKQLRDNQVRAAP